MNPSIVNNRARTVQGSDGKAQPTTSSRGRSAQARRTRGFEPKQCRLQTPDLVRLLCPRLPREN